MALACEHIGVTRTKTDAYFDGVQGKRLVKIIPFNHPLSPTDLEQLKGELAARAKVSVKRKKNELHVTIEDFTSPTIIERLDSQDSRLFKAQVTDWRFMVDCVMIDPAYRNT